MQSRTTDFANLGRCKHFGVISGCFSWIRVDFWCDKGPRSVSPFCFSGVALDLTAFRGNEEKEEKVEKAQEEHKKAR